MTNFFKLSYSWDGPVREPWRKPEDYVDADALWIAWDAFAMSHDGGAELVVGEHRLEFDLEADVRQVLEDLPDVLEALAAGTPDKQELWFMEQGTEIMLVIEPGADPGTVRLRIIRGPQPGTRFDAIPDDLGTVDVDEFVAGWRRLALDALDYVERLYPDLAEDESARDYRSRLAALD